MRQHEKIAYDDLVSAGHELRAIVNATEAAALAIMRCAETVMNADPSRAEFYRVLVERQMLSIFESLSFQDLTGQRIGNVIGLLQRLEGELSRAAATAPVDASQARRGRRKAAGDLLDTHSMLHGPQPEGKGNSQAEIDALLQSMDDASHERC